MRATGDEPIRIGISSCLLGESVRFDGGHKRDRFLTDTLGRHVQWVSVCPEVEVGLGVPREPVRLVRERGVIRMLTTKTGVDHTGAMHRYAVARVATLAREGLCGYVLKKGSPSCGMERVKVYGSTGTVSPEPGQGMFARVLMAAMPHLPVEEEGRLCDPRLRENFIERVFAYHRLRRLFRARWATGDLVAFHAAHKMQLLAHAREGLDRMGRLVARAGTLARKELRDAYSAAFMEALAVRVTPRRHANVLQHMAGHLRRHLDGPARRELAELIEDYRSGLVPLVAPLVLVRHYARRFAVSSLERQTYLGPHPKEMMLRNRV